MTEPETPPIVVVGASAGGVEALRQLAAGLPADLAAGVLVVLHIPPTATSALPMILDRAGPLPARSAVDGERVRPGEIVVAPPNHHLVVRDGRVALTHGPQENGHRPAVDVLFRSAARNHGARAIGVILSGSLDDGASGMRALTARGGTGIVQDFDEALYPGMPVAAAQAAAGVHVSAVGDIPGLLVDVIAKLPDLADPDPSDPDPGPSELLDLEARMSELDPDAMHDLDRPGVPAGFGCPDCAGALYRIEEGPLLRFRCRVGHAWSAESLLDRQSTSLEDAVWIALRALEEKVTLNSELHRRATEQGRVHSSVRFASNASESRQAADMVRRLVIELGGQVAARAGDDEVGADVSGGQG